jgi:S1-C subfamily serine protease
MFSNRRSLIAIAMLLCGASAQGQTDAELEQQVRAAEAQLRDSAAQTREAERATAAEAQEIDALMRQAEAQLAEAAQQIAELSQKQMPRMSGLERRIFIDRSRPVLGVNVGTDEDDGPVEGAEIVAVSPGGAAAEAGLRAGDIITAVNGESMSAGSGAEASRLLVDFMQGVVDGDVLEIDYLRNGNVRNLEVAPRSMTATLFSAGGPNFDVHVAPGTLATPTEPHARAFWIGGGSWGDMEMVALTERLGSYFGTDEGLLVVRAPRDEALKLQDGDVIRSIGGRVPNSVSHAMRILASYQAGEKLEIEIMRDRKKRTLDIEMPDNRTGSLRNFTLPAVRGRVMKEVPAPGN